MAQSTPVRLLIWIPKQAGLAECQQSSKNYESFLTSLVKLHFRTSLASVELRPVAQIAADDAKSLALVFTDDILSGQASSPLF